MFLALFLTFIPLLIIDLFTPFIIRKTTVFGISIPEPFVDDSQLQSFKRKYTLRIACFQIPLVSLIIVLSFFVNEWIQSILLIIGLLFYLAISVAVYLFIHKEVKLYKMKQGWDEQVRIVRVSKFESKFDKKSRAFPHALFIPAFFITIGITIWLITIYPQLPNVIPTHWGPSGQPDAWSDKSFFSVFFLIFILLFQQTLLYGIAYGVFHSAVNIKAHQSELSLQREQKIRDLNTRMMAILNIGITLFLGVLDVQSFWGILYSDSSISSIIYVLPLFLLLTFGSVYYYMKQSKKLNEQFKEVDQFESAPGDDENWKWGIFYFNKEDPDVFIEKKFGIGWTINFARPGAWIFIIIVVFVPLIPIFFI